MHRANPRGIWLCPLMAALSSPAAANSGDAIAPELAFVERPVMLSSGWAETPADQDGEKVLFETVVSAPDAPWVRLVLSPDPDTVLSGDPAASNASYLRFTSLADGAMQRLDGEHIRYWGHTSAFFNGDAVRVELVGSPGVGPSRVVILSALAGREELVVDRTICQSVDDRQLSSDPRAGRLMTVICTAWLFNDLNSTLLTAGHCSVSSTSVMHFNVPLSTSTGGAVSPPPEDQYPVDLGSSQGVGGGIGADWRYFGCFPNSNTGLTAFQRQMARYALAPSAPPVNGQTIRITGYGTVSNPVSLTWRYAQKTHAGPYAALSGTTVRYHTDTTGGNSGSAVLDESTGLAIGIHTHGGCNTSATSSNQGTAIQFPALQAALNAPRGVCASGRGAPVHGLYVSGDVNNSLGTLNRASGNFAKLAEVAAVMQGLTYDSQAGVLLGVDRSGVLHAIEPGDGEAESGATISGLPAGSIVNGLGMDNQSGVLYGMLQANGQLVRIDKATGEATTIGAPRGGNVGALEFDPSTRLLFGIDDAPAPTGSRLVVISTADGSRTVIGALGPGIIDCNGLAWSEADGWLYTINASNESLLRVNRWTGAARLVGTTGGLFGASYGLAATAVEPARTRCRADFNGVDGLNYLDMVDYMIAWFARHPAAEIDAAPGIDEKDIFVFLAIWLAGCE